MPVLQVNLEGDGAWVDLREKLARGEVIHLADDAVIGLSGLAGGMQSGRPSVAMRFDLPDGRTVIAETSLALLLAGADALKARFGDPR